MEVIDGGVTLHTEASSFWVHPSIFLRIYNTLGCAFERLSFSKIIFHSYIKSSLAIKCTFGILRSEDTGSI